MKPNHSNFARTFAILLIFLFAINSWLILTTGNSKVMAQSLDLDKIEQELNDYMPDPKYEDDPFILITVKEALIGARERNGGIGACLVQEATGEIMEQTHNRQYEPYFRSDRHAEMDLLDRYEEKMHLKRSNDFRNPTILKPRSMKGLILYTSMEPCPMCFTRIINAGVKKLYYAVPDDNGGMAHMLTNLPSFWQGMAQGMVVKPARCSPTLKIIAQKLFRPMARSGPNEKIS